MHVLPSANPSNSDYEVTSWNDLPVTIMPTIRDEEANRSQLQVCRLVEMFANLIKFM